MVGSGIAGLTTAHVLGPHHDVTVYEASDRLGGHTNTIDVVDPVAGTIGVDTGFIVHNDRNYPNLVRLFEELGVTTQASEMSFSVTDQTVAGRPFTYRATNLATLMADRRRMVDPRMWRMIVDVLRFYRRSRHHLEHGDPTITLSEFLAQGGYGPTFVERHLIPMGAAVWSADPGTFDRYPASSLLEFFDHHGLLAFRDRPEWRTVVGGSRRYVDAIVSRFPGTVHTGTPIRAVRRDEGAVFVRLDRGEQRFDRVVLACHADDALGLLSDPSLEEKTVLGAIRFQPNRATLHTDISVLPPTRRAWAAWNYERNDVNQRSARVTYDLTRLQRLRGRNRYLVSLNMEDRIDASTVLATFDYAHPVFDREAIEAQRRFDDIDGEMGTHFAGAWWGHGFHEDGVVSALRVCRRLGVTW